MLQNTTGAQYVCRARDHRLRQASPNKSSISASDNADHMGIDPRINRLTDEYHLSANIKFIDLTLGK